MEKMQSTIKFQCREEIVSVNSSIGNTIVPINECAFYRTPRVHGFEKQSSGIDLDVGRSNPSAERCESMAYGYTRVSRSIGTTRLRLQDNSSTPSLVPLSMITCMCLCNEVIHEQRNGRYPTTCIRIYYETSHSPSGRAFIQRIMRYRGQRHINVSIRTKHPDRAVVGSILRRKLLDCVIDRKIRPTWKIWKATKT